MIFEAINFDFENINEAKAVNTKLHKSNWIINNDTQFL